MSPSRPIFILIFCCLILSGFSSCAARKVAVEKESGSKPSDLESVLNNGPYVWSTFYCSGEVQMESPFFSGSGQYTLRMQHDSLVWMVVRYLGLEVARLQANKDSVVLINRFARSVDVYNWPEIQKMTGFPASFQSLQRLVLGWVPLESPSWQVLEMKDGQTTVMGKSENIQLHTTVLDPDYRMSHCRFRDTGNGTEILGRQEGWTKVDGMDLAHARQWEMKPDPDSRVFLQVLIKDGSFVGPLQFPFSIPDRYARGR
jgi:hypothetical protein